jgi:dTDP-glucose 4,6-dehydratase
MRLRGLDEKQSGRGEMRVLVTGAAGFIGSNLAHYLAEQRPEWQITALDLLTYAGNLENLSGLINQSGFEFVKADISQAEEMRALFARARFDLVFHLAAESHVDRSNEGAMDFVRTNVLGTQSLLSAAMQHGVGRFVHISTDEVYGSLGATGAFSEETPLNPTNPYAASKAASDLMALACYKTHKFEVIVTRCTNNYGPYQFPEKLIPLFITNALEGKRLPLYGDGMNVRSWIFVRDHCAALLLAGERGQPGEVYNIGCRPDGEIPNVEMTRRILRLLGKPETLIQKVADRPAHDRRYAVDFGKIRERLGWEPQMSLDDGLAATVEWYVRNRVWWEKVKSGEYLEYYQRRYGGM